MRPFVAADLAEIQGWYRARGMPVPAADAFPALGFIVPGVAFGAMYRTDAPSVALLDGFVSSPTAPLRARRAALAAIVERLQAEAKERGVRVLQGFTSRRGMERLVGRLGWRSAGAYLLMTKEV